MVRWPRGWAPKQRRCYDHPDGPAYAPRLRDRFGAADAWRACLCAMAHRASVGLSEAADRPARDGGGAGRLAVESEAATALGFRLAQAFDEEDALDAAADADRQILGVQTRTGSELAEAMEAHGGAGYVEAGRCRGCSANRRSTRYGKDRAM